MREKISLDVDDFEGEYLKGYSCNRRFQKDKISMGKISRELPPRGDLKAM